MSDDGEELYDLNEGLNSEEQLGRVQEILEEIQTDEDEDEPEIEDDELLDESSKTFMDESDDVDEMAAELEQLVEKKQTLEPEKKSTSESDD